MSAPVDLAKRRAALAERARQRAQAARDANEVWRETVAAAYAEAATTERERIIGIMRLPEADGRFEVARALALEPGMTAEAAARVLAATPKASAAKVPTIAERMASGGTIDDEECATEIGASSAHEAPASSTDAAWKSAIAKTNARR